MATLKRHFTDAGTPLPLPCDHICQYCGDKMGRWFSEDGEPIYGTCLACNWANAWEDGTRRLREKDEREAAERLALDAPDECDILEKYKESIDG